MKHSRPGFATRTKDDVPAKLNQDMIPAINRNAPKESTTLKQTLQAKADAAHKRNMAEAQALASAAPEILVNPAPSATPHINEPGK